VARRRAKRRKDGLGWFGAIWRSVRDNSFTLVFAGIFLVFLAGEALTGLELYRSQHQAAHLPLGRFLTTGTFLNAIFVNWQAAILQLACLIVFGVFLIQKGATHSKRSPRNARRRSGSFRRWVYGNSLGLAFFGLFAASFILHLVTGVSAYNEERALTHEAPVSFAEFIVSAKFWFLTFQTWQAEFFAIGIYMLFSIFLRQQGSPESKPLDAPDADTGEANN
jgi:hypothetical protein